MKCESSPTAWNVTPLTTIIVWKTPSRIHNGVFDAYITERIVIAFTVHHMVQ